MCKEKLHQLLDDRLAICPDSPSHLVWRTGKFTGKPALTSKDAGGYLVGKIGNKHFKAHRAVFYLAQGFLPEAVDHVDGDRTNNNPDNLRAADVLVNRHNRISKGYSWNKADQCYIAYISTNGIRRHLGCFSNEDEARAAHLAAKRTEHPTAPERCYG